MTPLFVELGARRYPIIIAQNALAQARIADYIAGPQVVVVTNTTVAPLYLATLQAHLSQFQVSTCILPDGEQYKDLTHFGLIMDHLLAKRCARDVTIIALGGGVIGDISGFAAACYQRGVDFIQMPTTLLSQVDSSVGGKTAVNHPLGKNMIGAFYQPQAVFIDTDWLQTLAPREFAAGMAEVIKYGIIYDADLFVWLENNASAIQAQEVDALTHMISRCCAIKAEIVAQDEKEKGLRALLNLGHTFGHAIEAEMGYGQWLHGEAVAVGMVIACHVAYQKGDLSKADYQRVVDLLQAYQLPVCAPDNMQLDDFYQHMAVDKKVQAGQIRFVIPTAIGRAEVTAEVTPEQVSQAITG